jgi:imidazolonepropionase-like amidohydrolase
VRGLVDLRRVALRASALLVLACAGPPPAPPLLLVRDALVFDGDRLLTHTSVLVRDGRIAAMGPGLAAPPHAEIVEAAGKTLLPGLIDAHAHVRGPALADELAFGVTTVLDMSTDPAWAAERRQEQREGKGLDRADLFSAGCLVTAPGGHGTEWERIPTIRAPGEAQGFVDARLAEGSDYIKIVHDDNRTFGPIIPTIDRPTLDAVVAAAHARGKLAVVHIGAVEGARAALEARADGLVHLSPDRPVDADLVALARQRRAFAVPTLSLNESLAGIASGAALADDPHLGPYLSRGARKQLGNPFHLRRQVDFQAVLTSVRLLRGGGVPILAGTDAPNPGTWHGISLHRELELLVRAGLTPLEALRAATSAPADAFRLPDRGRIAPGKRADLLLVAGDPTAAITATRAIERVWKLGVAFDREAFRAHLPGDRRLPLYGGLVVLVLVAAVAARRRRRLQRISTPTSPPAPPPP